ncbi:hypothetical protein EYV94_22960 [Puteibacter caeruleilacunae]|nr:hypothetical protein EYV94_22960 [Puteibacter caeruleilacunae]
MNFYDTCIEIDRDANEAYEIVNGSKHHLASLEDAKDIEVGGEVFTVECYSNGLHECDCEPYWMFCTREHGILISKTFDVVRDMKRFRGKEEPIRTIIEEIKKDTVFYNLCGGSVNEIMLRRERKGKTLYCN